MKKATRLLAVLLVLVLMLGVCVTTAQADDCYEGIKTLFSKPNEYAEICLGEGFYFDTDVDSSSVYFIANVEKGHVGVTGINARGQQEGYAWANLDAYDTLMAFIDFCLNYDVLVEELDDCQKLVGGLKLREDSDTIIVDSVDMAYAVVEAIYEDLAN